MSALEQEFEGEKIGTRYILEQVRLNADDLAALRTRADRIEARLDAVARRLSAIEVRLDRSEAVFHTFQMNLPRRMADTMREVLAERDARR